jgi:RNA polymerase sigma-70 factor, ECF subfamily
MPVGTSEALDELYRSDWGRIVATLIRLVGDFDLAEECAQEAFTTAVEQWEKSGVPDFPRAWIISTARHKAIDRIRRQKNLQQKLEAEPVVEPSEEPNYDTSEIPDDLLRLIFTCCHPSLSLEAQVALTLRTLCGLQTDEIARAFLVPIETMAQRIVRAKKKISIAKIPYVVPSTNEMPERLDAALTVIYLVFNEGYAATRGGPLVRTDLCNEAIRLCRLLKRVMEPKAPSELTGLLALMLLQDARRDARLNQDGDLVILEEQDRTLWNYRQIEEAMPLVSIALRGDIGPFTLQAAIAALHCQARRPEQTDWRQIVSFYDLLERVHPSPIVSLNRAVAVAMAEGLKPGLALIESLASSDDLREYHLLHAARADLLRRSGSFVEAATSYRRALELVTNDSERRYLERRLNEVQSAAS